MDATTTTVLAAVLRAMELLETAIPHHPDCEYPAGGENNRGCTCGLWDARVEIREAQRALYEASRAVRAVGG